jgi:tRNA wybutosine-synthesizing protein 2
VISEGGEEFTFDRIVMGYYDAAEYLDSALDALGTEGWLHMHEATPTNLVPERPERRLREAVEQAGHSLNQSETRRVKGYSEGVTHVVVDAKVE